MWSITQDWVEAEARPKSFRYEVSEVDPDTCVPQTEFWGRCMRNYMVEKCISLVRKVLAGI